MNTNTDKFLAQLALATSEEMVKAAYVAHFKWSATMGKIDLRVGHVIFEFKHDGIMTRTKARPLAQLMYYMRNLHTNGSDQPLPGVMCIADRNEAAITNSSLFDYYTRDHYDWRRPASNPDPALVQDIAASAACQNLKVFDFRVPGECALFCDAMHAAMQQQTYNPVQKPITELNFETVFMAWCVRVGKNIPENARIRAFLADLRLETQYHAPTGSLRVWIDGNTDTYPMPERDHAAFWALFQRPPTARALESILAKVDRLRNLEDRRFKGEFFTPRPYAILAHEHLAKALGPNWFREYKIWDMAAGTGNLEYDIPDYSNLYLSTLEPRDVEYMREVFPTAAAIFQYDYLNDDAQNVLDPASTATWKLPQKLRDDLANPDNQWLILMNPPYAEATNGAYAKGSKGTVAQTPFKTRAWGKASNELFMQFLYRLSMEIPNATVAMFSKLKFLQAPGCIHFYAHWVAQKHFEGGFIMPSMQFHGTKGKFPVAFSIWSPGKTHLSLQRFDLYDGEQPVRIGHKDARMVHPSDSLTVWIPRPKNTEPAVPLKGALLPYEGKARLDRAAAGALGFSVFNSNDLQNSGGKVFVVSGVYGGSNGFSVTPDNFDRFCIGFAARKAVKQDWLNDRDQYHAPLMPPSAEFQGDAAVYTLLHGQMRAADAIVEYQGAQHRLLNHFYPFAVEDVRGFDIENLSLRAMIRQAQTGWVAQHLSNMDLSPQARAVFSAALDAHEVFYRHFNSLNRPTWQLSHPAWAFGWYQVRKSLQEAGLATAEMAAFKAAYKALETKLQGFVYEYGILTRPVIEQEDSP